MTSRLAEIRDECLNEHWFTSLTEARIRIDIWWREYDEWRPHSSLGDLTPAEFAARCRGKLARKLEPADYNRPPDCLNNSMAEFPT